MLAQRESQLLRARIYKNAAMFDSKQHEILKKKKLAPGYPVPAIFFGC
jgi:hypothetical protein